MRPTPCASINRLARAMISSCPRNCQRLVSLSAFSRCASKREIFSRLPSKLSNRSMSVAARGFQAAGRHTQAAGWRAFSARSVHRQS